MQNSHVIRVAHSDRLNFPLVLELDEDLPCFQCLGKCLEGGVQDVRVEKCGPQIIQGGGEGGVDLGGDCVFGVVRKGLFAILAVNGCESIKFVESIVVCVCPSANRFVLGL